MSLANLFTDTSHAQQQGFHATRFPFPNKASLEPKSPALIPLSSPKSQSWALSSTSQTLTPDINRPPVQGPNYHNLQRSASVRRTLFDNLINDETQATLLGRTYQFQPMEHNTVPEKRHIRFAQTEQEQQQFAAIVGRPQRQASNADMLTRKLPDINTSSSCFVGPEDENLLVCPLCSGELPSDVTVFHQHMQDCQMNKKLLMTASARKVAARPVKRRKKGTTPKQQLHQLQQQQQQQQQAMQPAKQPLLSITDSLSMIQQGASKLGIRHKITIVETLQRLARLVGNNRQSPTLSADPIPALSMAPDTMDAYVLGLLYEPHGRMKNAQELPPCPSPSASYFPASFVTSDSSQDEDYDRDDIMPHFSLTQYEPPVTPHHGKELTVPSSSSSVSSSTKKNVNKRKRKAAEITESN